MRILQVAPLYYPAPGGVERHVQAISEALVRSGHEVVVAAVRHAHSLPRRTTINDVQVLRFLGLGPQAYHIPFGMYHYLRRQGPHFDVVHAHNYGGLPLLLAILACGKQTVITPHYHGHGNSPVAELLHRLYDPLAAAALRRGGGVVCVSTGEAQAVVKKLGLLPNDVTVIPNIIPIQEVITSEEKQSALDVQAPRCLILSVGRLVAYKRTDRIIAALPYLPASYTLTLIGEGPERTALQKLATRLGVHDRVQFLGVVTDDELRHWYMNARIVVSLSTGEAFGRVVVEALSSNCQVIGSDIPAFRDFAAEFPQAVSLVSLDTPAEAVANALRTAVARPLYAPINLQRFTWPEVIKNLLKVYADIVAHARLHQTAAMSTEPSR